MPVAHSKDLGEKQLQVFYKITNTSIVQFTQIVESGLCSDGLF